jgi:Lung seven transmembrane receptor
MPLVLHGAIQSFNLVMEPTDAFVHYNDGYIRAPGFIDLGDLTFTAISEAMDIDDSFGGDDGYTDDVNGTAGDDMGGGGNATSPPSRRGRHRHLDGGVEKGYTALDIAVFRLPRKCVHSKTGCDWAELGVGKRSDDGALRWCCSAEAVALGLCEESDKNFGRLMIDSDKFTGNHRFVTVPPEGLMSKQIRYGKMEETESGSYVVLYANCNERGREIYVTGESVWKSKHGYLPGELFGFMFFYTVLTLVYFGLLVWVSKCSLSLRCFRRVPRHTDRLISHLFPLPVSLVSPCTSMRSTALK